MEVPMGTARTAADVCATLVRMFGDGMDHEIARLAKGCPRLVHSVAAWRSPDGLRIIKIVPGKSPRSETDWFIFNAARARCACLLTSGKMLRDEPLLRHDQWADAHPGLLAWRSECCGFPARPNTGWWTRTAILTHKMTDEMLAHAFLRSYPEGAQKPIVYTPADDGTTTVAPRDKTEGSERELELECRVITGGGIGAALNAKNTVGSALVEYGSAVDELYLTDKNGQKLQPRSLSSAGKAASAAASEKAAEEFAETFEPLIDELQLSIYEEPTLDPELIGPPLTFPHEDQFAALFPKRVGGDKIFREISGKWRFMLFYR